MQNHDRYIHVLSMAAFAPIERLLLAGSVRLFSTAHGYGQYCSLADFPQHPVIDDARAVEALLIELGWTMREASGTLNEGTEDWLIG